MHRKNAVDRLAKTPSRELGQYNIRVNAIAPGAVGGDRIERVLQGRASVGATLGVAISAAIFGGISDLEGVSPLAEIAMGRTDNLNVRFAASVALMFNVVIVIIAIIAIMVTVPRNDPRATRS